MEAALNGQRGHIKSHLMHFRRLRQTPTTNDLSWVPASRKRKNCSKANVYQREIRLLQILVNESENVLHRIKNKNPQDHEEGGLLV